MILATTSILAFEARTVLMPRGVLAQCSIRDYFGGRDQISTPFDQWQLVGWARVNTQTRNRGRHALPEAASTCPEAP